MRRVMWEIVWRIMAVTIPVAIVLILGYWVWFYPLKMSMILVHVLLMLIVSAGLLLIIFACGETTEWVRERDEFGLAREWLSAKKQRICPMITFR